jgi:two-component system sensor histidine kinase KdpD
LKSRTEYFRRHSGGKRQCLSNTELKGYAAAAAGVLAATAATLLLPPAGEASYFSLLYLLIVIGVALNYGTRPAILASLLSFLTYNWSVLEPRYGLTLPRAGEWPGLVRFLIVSLVTGQLALLLRTRSEEVRQRSRESDAQAAASWAVASQVECIAALEAVLRALGEVVEVSAAAIAWWADGSGPKVVAWGKERQQAAERAKGAWRPSIEAVLRDGRSVGWEVFRAPRQQASIEASELLEIACLPLTIDRRVLGVLILAPGPGRHVSREARRVVTALTSLAAVVLERDRLVRAETRAQALAEADRLKTALLSMVSHNFRSPLASIKACVTGLLQEGTPWDPASQRELLQAINQETDRLTRVVANILALSRLQSDAWRPQLELTSIEDLVGMALDTFPAESNRRIRVELAPEIPEIWADPVQLVEVLYNLIDNALRYSPRESLIELRASSRDEDVLLEILDRGPGLPEGESDRVFEPFYRVPTLRESAVGGIGLGLAVGRGLVEAHGGQITAENREGGGAVFRVCLPRAPGPSLGHAGEDRETSGHR